MARRRRSKTRVVRSNRVSPNLAHGHALPVADRLSGGATACVRPNAARLACIGRLKIGAAR